MHPKPQLSSFERDTNDGKMYKFVASIPEKSPLCKPDHPLSESGEKIGWNYFKVGENGKKEGCFKIILLSSLVIIIRYK